MENKGEERGEGGGGGGGGRRAPETAWQSCPSPAAGYSKGALGRRGPGAWKSAPLAGASAMRKDGAARGEKRARHQQPPPWGTATSAAGRSGGARKSWRRRGRHLYTPAVQRSRERSRVKSSNVSEPRQEGARPRGLEDPLAGRLELAGGHLAALWVLACRAVAPRHPHGLPAERCPSAQASQCRPSLRCTCCRALRRPGPSLGHAG